MLKLSSGEKEPDIMGSGFMPISRNKGIFFRPVSFCLRSSASFWLRSSVELIYLYNLATCLFF